MALYTVLDTNLEDYWSHRSHPTIEGKFFLHEEKKQVYRFIKSSFTQGVFYVHYSYLTGASRKEAISHRLADHEVLLETPKRR